MSPDRGQRAVDEAWLRPLVEHAPAIFFLCDRRGTVRQVFGRGLQGLRLSPPQTVGRSAFTLFAAVPWVVDSLRRALAGEAFLVTGETEGRWFDVQYVPLRDEHGDVHEVCGLAWDVTERVHAVEASRSAHRDYEALVDSIDGIVWEADAANFRFTFVSRQAERLLGFPVEAWYQPGFWATHLHNADRDGALQYCRESTAAGLPHDFEYRMLAADGREVWLRDIVNVVEAPDGRVLLRGVMVDITVQKQLEAERLKLLDRASQARARAEKAERRWAFLAEASSALSASLDEDVLLDTVARLAVQDRVATWCALFLLRGEQQELRAFAHTEEARGEELHRRLARQPPPVLPEAGAQGVHGTRVLTVALAQGGRRLGTLTLGVDPPSPAFDEDDTSLAEELACRCSLALENARLFRAERDAVRLREDFLCIASHELRTPLTPLFLRLRVLEKRLAGTPLDHEVQKLRGSADRLRGLVEDLLDVTKIDEGEIPLRREHLSLRDLVRDLVTSHASVDARHTLEFSAPDDEVLVFGDRGRLEQVLSNLLDNALKYSPAGGEVRVSLALQHGDAVLAVADQGIGIPADQQAGLFERFFRARNAKVTSFGGLGLGLYISRDIVTRHGGSIWLESEVGRGSTFFVRLPLAAARSEAAGDAAPTT